MGPQKYFSAIFSGYSYKTGKQSPGSPILITQHKDTWTQTRKIDDIIARHLPDKKTKQRGSEINQPERDKKWVE